MSRLFSRAWPLRVWIAAVFAPLMAAFALTLLFAYEAEVRRVVAEQAQRDFERVTRQTAAALSRALEPARAWVQAARVAPWGARPEDDEFIAASVLMATQERYPQLGSLYFGYDDGGFARVLPIRQGSPAGSGVQAPANAAFAEQLLRPGRFDERWRFFDANSRAIGESVRPARAFDPRERPWYRLAVKTPGQVVVTEPYVFSATREIGITVAATLRERPGAVAGADITLNDLSLFLSDQLPASNAKLLLFDAAGMVWASSEIQRLKASAKTELVPSLKEYGGSAYDALLPMASTALDVGQGSGVSHELRDSDQRQWRVSVGAVARVIGPPVFLAVLVDQDALQTDLKRLRQLALLFAVAGVVLSGLLAFWAARRVSRPLQDLSIDATRLARLDLSDPNRPASGLREVDQVHQSLRVARAGLRGYARYVPRRLVEHLLANHIEPVPSAIERDVTMFIASIEGLMPIIRNLSASELVERSEYYLQGVTDAVAEEDGIVDKFYGDALVCFFNAPVASSRHPSMACRAALAARSRFDAASEMAAMEGRGKLHVRFLLHTGVAVVGNFGTSERLTYTAVGVAPTVAARLMRCHAIYGSPTLVSGTVWAQAQKGFVFRFVDKVTHRDFDRPVDLYELLAVADDSEASATAQALASRCDAARALYDQRDWAGSHERYLELAHERPYDTCIKVMAARTASFLKDPPPQEWDLAWRI